MPSRRTGAARSTVSSRATATCGDGLLVVDARRAGSGRGDAARGRRKRTTTVTVRATRSWQRRARATTAGVALARAPRPRPGRGGDREGLLVADRLGTRAGSTSRRSSPRRRPTSVAASDGPTWAPSVASSTRRRSRTREPKAAPTWPRSPARPPRGRGRRQLVEPARLESRATTQTTPGPSTSRPSSTRGLASRDASLAKSLLRAEADPAAQRELLADARAQRVRRGQRRARAGAAGRAGPRRPRRGRAARSPG